MAKRGIMLELKHDIDGSLLKIREEKPRTPPVDDVLFFFKHCFTKAEEKYRVLFLTQLGFGCRIAEVCALNINDVLPDTNFRVWRMLILKKKENLIVRKELPEAIAAILRNWIIENKDYIMDRQGYIFPHRSNNRYCHVQPSHAQNFFCKKRKILIRSFPERSFGEVEGYKHYKSVENSMCRKERVEKVYIWRTHIFRRLSATFMYLLSKDALLVKGHLNHSDLKTTTQHYIDPCNQFMSDKHRLTLNSLFDKDFYDGVKTSGDSGVVAVWDELKRF